MTHGKCVSDMHNTFKTGNAQQEVLLLGPTMYFGELALLRGEPRAATVAALSDTSLLMLARQDFNQLLGPLQTLLGQHAALYGPTQPTDARQVGKPPPPHPYGGLLLTALCRNTLNIFAG